MRIEYPEDDLLPDFLINSLTNVNETIWGDKVHSSQDGIVENVTTITALTDFTIEVSNVIIDHHCNMNCIVDGRTQ